MYSSMCVVTLYLREASKSEVEKEYRKKATAAPWDMLRLVVYILSGGVALFRNIRSRIVCIIYICAAVRSSSYRHHLKHF